MRTRCGLREDLFVETWIRDASPLCLGRVPVNLADFSHQGRVLTRYSQVQIIA